MESTKRSKKVFKMTVLSFIVLTPSTISTDFVRRGGGGSGWIFPQPTQQSRRKEHFLHECDQTLASFFQLLNTRGGAGGYDREYDINRQYSGEMDNAKQRRNNQDHYSGRSDQQQQYGGYVYDEYDDDFRNEKKSGSSAQRNDKASLFTSSFASVTSSLPNVLKNGERKIGLGLLGSGLLITMLGITLFFNRTLMRIGNLLFIAGVPLTIGPTRTIAYFAKPEKIRSTSCLLLGIFLVFMGHPTFGMALEIFGLLNLFGNMFPFLIVLAKQIPGISTLFNSGASTTRRSREKQEQTDTSNYEYNDFYDETYESSYDDAYR